MPLVRTRPNLAVYLAGMLILALAAYGPIAQLVNYHAFADQRTLFGLPHAGDVLSNLAFLAAAVYGALRMRQQPQWNPAQALFVAALAFTAAGSTYYHLAPDNARLLWDRLPIAVACAALLAGALADASPRLKPALPVLVAFGVASVLWWCVTGDLRPYLLIQGAPLLLIPALQWQTSAPVGRRTAFVVAIVLYVLAKMFELADSQVMDAVGLVSGHTIKHLLAAGAAVVLVRQFGESV